MNRLHIDIPNPLLTVEEKIHLRIQQRTATKRITTLHGLSSTMDLKEITRQLRKKLCCNGAIVIDPDTTEQYIQFTGDQRQEIALYLVEKNIASKNNIIIHGY